MDSMQAQPIYEQTDSLHFEIAGEFFQAFRRWATAIDQRVYQEQLAGQFTPAGDLKPESLKMVREICQDMAQAKGRAYYGTGGDGGGYRFIFSPSNLGTGITAENYLTGERIDLTRDVDW